MKAWSVIPLLAMVSSVALAQNDNNPLAIDVGTVLLVLIGICVVVAVGVVFWAHHHKTLAEQELETLRAKFDEHVRLKEPTGAPLTLALHLDATQFHEEMDNVSAALNNFKKLSDQVVNSVSGDLESAFKRIMEARIESDGKVSLPSGFAVEKPPVKLGSVFIDRDDLMKAVGNDFPQSVTLDGKPVHNGILGPVLAYWTWPDGQGVHNEPYMEPDRVRPPQPQVMGAGGAAGTLGGVGTVSVGPLGEKT